MENLQSNLLVNIVPNSKITIELEKNFWKKYILNILINIHNRYPLCKYNSISIIENNSINNLYVIKNKM